jgi:hypothetical protein
MLLFLAVTLEDTDLKNLSQAQKLTFLENLIQACKQHEFDGLVLKQDNFCPEQYTLLKRASELAPELVIISQGFDIRNAK